MVIEKRSRQETKISFGILFLPLLFASMNIWTSICIQCHPKAPAFQGWLWWPHCALPARVPSRLGRCCYSNHQCATPARKSVSWCGEIGVRWPFGIITPCLVCCCLMEGRGAMFYAVAGQIYTQLVSLDTFLWTKGFNKNTVFIQYHAILQLCVLSTKNNINRSFKTYSWPIYWHFWAKVSFCLQKLKHLLMLTVHNGTASLAR